MNFGCKWESMRMSEWGLARGQDYMYECTKRQRQQTAERDEEINATCVCASACTTVHQSSASASGNHTHYFCTVPSSKWNFYFFRGATGTVPQEKATRSSDIHALHHKHHRNNASTRSCFCYCYCYCYSATRNRRRTPLFLVLSPVVNCPLLFWWHCNDHFLHFHPHPPWCCSHCWHVFHVFHVQ